MFCISSMDISSDLNDASIDDGRLVESGVGLDSIAR